MKLLRDGAAWTTCLSDKRFEFTISDIQCGGFVMPNEVKTKLDELEKKYGEIPKDLSWHYEKY